MGLLYISIFFFGMISTGMVILITKKLIARRDRLKEEEKRIMQFEEGGWIKTKYEFAFWTDRHRMEKWQKSIKDDLEMSIWTIFIHKIF